MALPQWTVNNGHSFGTFAERVTQNIPLPLASTDGVTTTLISGKLPTGMRIEDNALKGTPNFLAELTVFAFVVRATNADGIADRTLKITIDGYDEPQWITQEGLLPVGNNRTYFILDSSPVDFQLEVIDDDTLAGETLTFFLGTDSTASGVLPPGLSMDSSGRITGIIDPIRALDINEIKLGYDAGRYGVTFDWGARSDDTIESYYYGDIELTNLDLVRPPRKLNRKYDFVVTVTDGTAFSSRKFTIYVITDEFTRADNTIMQVGTNVFVSDMTFERVPIWVTPSDLGQRRANNYQTIYLNIVDQPTVSGAIFYQSQQRNPGVYQLKSTGETTTGYYELTGLLPFFPVANRGPDSTLLDGTPNPITVDEFTVVEEETVSELPPGLELDPNTGELAGRIPYQPAVSRDYKFSVNALRYNEDTGIVTVFGTFIEDTLAGASSIKIAKLSTDLSDGIDDLASLVNQSIELNGRNYKITSVSDSNTEFDELSITPNLQPLYKYNSLVLTEAAENQDYFYVNTLGPTDKLFYNERSLNYSSTESYTIQNTAEYVKYTVETTIDNVLELVTNTTGQDSASQPVIETLEDFLSLGDLPAYITGTNGTSGLYKLTMYIPETANTTNSSYIKGLFHTDDSAVITATKLATFTRVGLDKNLSRVLNTGQVINLGASKADSFSKSFTQDESNIVEKIKTFNLTLIGEIDSVLSWVSNANLGTIQPNLQSTFAVEATSTYAGANLSYSLASGRLPFGMTLKRNGEIVGKFPSQGTVDNPGLTKFDSDNTTFDANTTVSDRTFKFTVLAKDRFAYTSILKEFTITIDTEDTRLYSNLYVKPLLPKSQRDTFTTFINNPNVFDPTVLYRPSDPEFGVQKELKSLIFAGIETNSVSAFSAASVKGVKRKSYYFGDIKTAVAKQPGTNNIIYEVVYVELNDPSLPKKGKTADFFYGKNGSKRITVDSIELEPIDDTFGGGAGGVSLDILKKDNTTFKLDLSSQVLRVIRRGGGVVEIPAVNSIPIDSRTGPVNIAIASVVTQDGLEETWRLRPDWTTIKVDSDAVNVSESEDRKNYITNIEKMRKNINNMGTTSKAFLPLWMQTAQGSDLEELGYTFAMPLVYTKPGNGEQIRRNIENYITTTGFDMKLIDYDIDRYIVNSVTDDSEEHYIMFGNYQFNN